MSKPRNGTVTIDAAELAALRTLAQRALETSEMIQEGRLVERRPHARFDPSDPLQWQETALIRTLVLARGETVPMDRLVEHTRTTARHSATDWVKAPTSQVSRARAKCRHIFGMECIRTVWPMVVNRKGQLVRACKRPIEGYAWIGPDLAGMALDVAAELGLIGEGD
jgi:hypothetical protein